MMQRADSGLRKVPVGPMGKGAVDGIIDIAAERRQTAACAAAMQTAVRVSPELQLYDRAKSVESAGFVADLLAAWASIDAVTAARALRVAIEVGMAVLDILVREETADEAAYVREAKAAVCNYLAPYLEHRARL